MQKFRIPLSFQGYPAFKLLNSLSSRESFLKRQVVHAHVCIPVEKGNGTALRAEVFCLKRAAPRLAEIVSTSTGTEGDASNCTPEDWTNFNGAGCNACGYEGEVKDFDRNAANTP